MLVLVIACVAAVLASLLVTPFVVRTAVARGLYDMPLDGRRMHTRPIPRVGGVAVFAAMALGLLAVAFSGTEAQLSSEQWRFFIGILLGAAVVFAAGLWDDLRGLSPVLKLTAQSLAAVVVFAFGFRIEILSFGASGELLLGALALPVTILWVVGVTNAFNLIDGLDGLATGIAIVALGTILAVAVALGNLEVVVVCVALLGALLGFLRYNFSPARIFLGDSGSQFIGFMLAVLSVHGSLKSATAVLVIIPLFALALPLLDTMLAIARRWLRGTPLSGADARHIHHRLLARGLTHGRAAVVLYLIATLLAILGLSLAFAPPAAVMGIALTGGGLTVALLLYGMRQLQYHEFAEAGAVLLSGVLRMRRVIRDQIHARDIAHLIQRAETIEQVDALLQEHTSSFGFLGMEVCREMSSGRRRGVLHNGQSARAWKLDHPVTPRISAEDDPYVLRIWCGIGDANRPYGAERAARILAPAIERWMVERKLAPSLEERHTRPAAEGVTLSDAEIHAALGWAGNGGGVASGRGSVANGHPLAEQALALHRSRRRD
ncbi:MAG: undecaprenyl/decaprenyl-phosphate alpha-N-acetylglucosaminyl 1-phosphate transferase [Gemmatimonadetes bacterium]|nr:undecaprenyl/decaprenyl-phosphate alpha-N-acetylglucosaminyl 1-phosphate transferase [Gemmatimonadota bacterium]